ncbi:transglutaminase family protein [Sneathiella limimaris]|uniref:transglutaminase family protein n=1 Tax=Sneathiella limimaris TaxID=1964213 RepID=UPI00146A7BBE|nr:transglutaminase family protein [Sneathiella limimaris]
MQTLRIRHRTEYRYNRPLSFGEHRLMFRPRDSHDLRHVSSELSLSPTAEVRWHHDVFSNSIAVAEFKEPSDHLVLESTVVVEHYGLEDTEFPIDIHAQRLPFTYSADEVGDLARTHERHYPDPEDRIVDWANRCLEQGNGETEKTLSAMTQIIREEFEYVTRNEEGTQAPDETLIKQQGTCRDFALLMIEAARTLGLAARFVTGYLYDPNKTETSGLRGAGATHAWTQVFLPGAGWIEYDPTNGIIGGTNLIRVAVTRDPSQAIVVRGTYFGMPEDFMDMQVSVTVEKINP